MKRIILCGMFLWALAGDLRAAATLTTLHTFTGVDGDAPVAGLAFGTNGNFYGTTEFGGTATNLDCSISGCGTLFEISTGGAFTSLYSFSNDDGNAPRAGLLQASDGNLYGTTSSGGPFGGLGNVFRFTPGGVLTNLHTFRGNDGITPEGTLIEGPGGILYGTTAEGGVSSPGTAYQISTNGVFTPQFNANPSPGFDQPAAGVMLASDGNFYGTSEFGGSSTNCVGGCGAIYRITPAGVVTNLHSFDKSDGLQPKSVLVEGPGGVLYGTTSGSPLGALNCSNGCGSVFSITTNGDFMVLHQFAGPEGKTPLAGLIFGDDGNLYGTASAGGGFLFGSVFQITTNGTLTKLVGFNGSNGGKPVAPLVLGPDGTFYGTTEVGGSGTNALGTVFKLTMTTNSAGNVNCELSPVLATNTVGSAHTVTATVTSNGAARVGALVNFRVIAGPNVNQTGTDTTSASGTGSFTYAGTTAGTDTIRAISLGSTGLATKVWIAAVANHDLAVIKLKAPKKITLSESKPNVTGKFTVSIQNIGDATETIPDLAALGNLVTLNVQSLGACANPVVVLATPKFAFPFHLAPKKKLNLAYTAVFDCANDPLPTSKTDAHNDYQVTANVDLSALGETDAASANNPCPRAPSGTDKGCGNKTPTGTLGGDIFTDVVAK